MVLLLVVIVSALSGFAPGLTDPDYYWHLKAGEAIVDAGTIPATDPFSYSFGGQPWVLHEWLFQLGLYLVYETFGPLGVLYATVLLFWLTWCVVFSVSEGLIRRPVLSLAFALLFGTSMAAFAAPRPQLASYLLFAIYCWLFFRAKYRGQFLGLLAAPMLMVLWPNLHAGYAIGIAMMVAFAGCEWLNFIFARVRGPEKLRLCLWLTGTAVAVLLASLINPYGIAYWVYPFSVMGMKFSSVITEWKTILTFPMHGRWYLGSGLLFFLLTMFRDKRPDASEILIPTALFAAGLLQARHTPFGLMGLLLFIAPAIRDGAIDNLDAVLRRASGPIESKQAPEGGRPPLGAAIFAWCLALVVAVIFIGMGRSAYYRDLDRLLLAAGAASFVEEAALEGRMFNEYDDGGYLIYRLFPGRKVFVDNRADLYGDVFLQTYYAVLKGARDHRPYFKKWAFEYAILASNSAMRRILALSGAFAVIFDDGVRAVLVRREGVNAGALARYPEIEG
jgi:hypothetical protein